MIPLTEGALDKIMMGIDVEKPILQILGHKKLASSSSGERYRLLVSDGKRVNSFTMLATQLNSMITDNILTEYSICQLNRYAISTVNNGGQQKRVMVLLSLDLKVPGEEVGAKIGNPTNIDSSTSTETDAKKPSSVKTKTVNVASSAQNKKNPTSDIVSTPIVALSPYQNKWIIKARVTNKSNIRTWSNSRGEGKLFSMDLVDETGEIRCTAFRDQCDKYFDMIEVGKVYYISRCTLKPANKNFSTLKNDYEMSMTPDTEIIPCHDDDEDIPMLQFDFSPISSIEQKEKNDIIDVLGIVKSCDEVQILKARATGKELKKRDVTLLDESNTMICLSLWGTEAENFDGSNNPVLAIKSARIGEFNGGKNLSTMMSSVMQIDPDIPQAHKLRGWYNSIGMSEQAKSLSVNNAGGGSMTGAWLTFGEAKDMGVSNNQAEDFIAKVTVNMIRTENLVYKSCPTDGCNKKLIDQANGMYRCEKCSKEFPSFKYRLLANVNFGDWTGHRWATAFNDEAEKLLNATAQELGELHESNKDAYMDKFSEATFKSFVVKFRSRMEVFNDEGRLKTTCQLVTPIDYKVYNDVLLKKIKDMVGIEKL